MSNSHHINEPTSRPTSESNPGTIVLSNTQEGPVSRAERQASQLRDDNLDSGSPSRGQSSSSLNPSLNAAIVHGSNNQTEGDDDMPALQSVSDFDDLEMDDRAAFTREANSAPTVPALFPQPHSAPRGERRPRVEDVEDEDDLRPTRRPRLNDVEVSGRANSSSEDHRYAAMPNPLSRNLGELGMVFTFDGAGNPIASFPLGPPSPPTLNNLSPLDHPLFGIQNPGNVSTEDRAALFRDIQAFARTMTGLFAMEEERDDPDRARKLVAGMEEVPYGLVKRMERIGDPSAEDTNTADSPTCAICWDTLLDPENGGFTVPDVNGSQTNSHGDTAGAESPDLTRAIHPEASDDSSLSNAPHSPSTIVVLPCSHVFHSSCLVPWFARPKHTTCPTCRFNVDPDNLTRKIIHTPPFSPVDLGSAPPHDPANGTPAPMPGQQNSTSTSRPTPSSSVHGSPVTDGNAAVNSTARGANPPEAQSIGNQPSPTTNGGFFVDVSFTVEPLPITGSPPSLRPNATPTPVPGDAGAQPAASATNGDMNATNTAHPAGFAPDIRGILTQIVSRAIAESFTAALGGVAINSHPLRGNTALAEDPTSPPTTGATTAESEPQPTGPSPLHAPGTASDASPLAAVDGNPEGDRPMVFGPFVLGRNFTGGTNLPSRAPAGVFGGQGRGGPAMQFALPLNIPMNFPFSQRHSSSSEGTPHEHPRKWSPPPAPGLTLRQRIEKRERELGLRCWDMSCGVGPSDDDPYPSSSTVPLKQIAVRRVHDDVPVCEHRFHPACLVVSERISGSVHADDSEKKVSVACSVCRASGVVMRDQWDEGVCALSE